MKKTTLLFFVIALFVSVTGKAEILSGNCGKDGDNLTYTLDTSTWILKIEGSGDMNDYGYFTAPWSKNINSKALLKVELPDGLTSIGEYAFPRCSSLTSITIPNSVTSIGKWAFNCCHGLTSITIPNSVTSIGDYAFYECDGLTSATIGNSVTRIGNYAFAECNGLTTINIPNSVTSIGAYAFEDCWSITSVTIPNSVTSIGGNAFNLCYFLNTTFHNNSSLEDSNNWGAIICDSEQQDGLMIKDNSVVRSRYWATSVTIPNTVTSIGERAFVYCPKLTSIYISNPVTSIGYAAFAHCSGLASVTIANSVTNIENRAFSYCDNLTTVTVGKSVTSIGDCTFQYCSNLKEIHIENNTPPSCGSSVFTDVKTTTCKLYVPTGSKEAYASAEGWKDFANIIEEDIIELETPKISFEDGKLIIASTTSGVTYMYSIKADNASPELTESADGIIDLTASYTITAYAKLGEKKSDPVTLTIPLSKLMNAGDVNGDGKIDITDVTTLVDSILNKK